MKKEKSNGTNESKHTLIKTTYKVASTITINVSYYIDVNITSDDIIHKLRGGKYLYIVDAVDNKIIFHVGKDAMRDPYKFAQEIEGVIEEMNTKCPECFCDVTQNELKVFNGICEACTSQTI